MVDCSELLIDTIWVNLCRRVGSVASSAHCHGMMDGLGLLVLVICKVASRRSTRVNRAELRARFTSATENVERLGSSNFSSVHSLDIIVRGTSSTSIVLRNC